MSARRAAARPPADGDEGRPLLPAAVAGAASLLAVLSAFLPWYAPDIAPPLTPDAVNGWDGTTAARLMVAAALVCMLASAVLAADARDVVALDRGTLTAVSALAALAASAALLAVAARTVRLPEPSAILARQLGLYVALGMCALAAGAALVQLTLAATGGPPRAARAQRRRPPRR